MTLNLKSVATVGSTEAYVYATRYHDISTGHRVYGHENKCRHLHGHNYRIHFTCTGALDTVGRVIDFGVIKERLCMWLEEQWDHKFLLWAADPLCRLASGFIHTSLPEHDLIGVEKTLAESFVVVPFNPTAENMALYLLHVIGPQRLAGTGVVLAEVKIEETMKCSAVATAAVEYVREPRAIKEV